ncbi:hypothetical protein [Desulfatibacillum alkenivorans]|uniref:hypothetical protein n=1 Tax=Desulfatibacillum alkenivorans TaxID=259354 RepID=UPI001FCCEB05|nr:hypothetical protein [Desulfatibacillum alkenivorans]
MLQGQPPDQGGGGFAAARVKKAAWVLVPMLCVGMHTRLAVLCGASFLLRTFGCGILVPMLCVGMHTELAFLDRGYFGLEIFGCGVIIGGRSKFAP